MNTDARLTAKLLSACPPDSAQKEKLEDVLSKKYGKAVELVWQEDRTAQGGFRIELGSEVIDWTAEGRLEQLKERLTGLKSEGSVIPLIRDAVKSWVPEVCAREVGSVLTVADGIAYVEGLEGATYGEILLFEGGIRGMVQELRSGRIGCILFGRVEEVSEGTAVYRTGKTAGIGVSDGMIGRVVDALGAPIDGGGDIRVDEYRMIESPAPGIIDRQPVNTPMQTGILSIDSMFPIGRGQRELIIGDRQTGKTAIAIDTILNQKGKDMICIYVAIGQKASSVAQIAALLDMDDADYDRADSKLQQQAKDAADRKAAADKKAKEEKAAQEAADKAARSEARRQITLILRNGGTVPNDLWEQSGYSAVTIAAMLRGRKG